MVVMAKTRHCNSVMICPPLTNAVFPATGGYLDGRTDEVPIRVKMAWGGVRSPPAAAFDGGRSNGGSVDRPRPAPSPETPMHTRHSRPAKVARPARCVRSSDSTFYSPRTKLVFLKDVSAIHYRQGCNKPRFPLLFLSYLTCYLLSVKIVV